MCGRCRYPYQAVTGFRFTGMAVYRPNDGTHSSTSSAVLSQRYVRFGRDYGWSLTPDTARDGFRQFLFDGRRVRIELVPPLLAQLRRLRAWMARQRLYRFYSSSLLLVYDGAPARVAASGTGADSSAGEADIDRATPRIVVRMIDFAHAIPRPPHHRDAAHVKPGAGDGELSVKGATCGGDCCYVHGLLRMEEALESLLMEHEDATSTVHVSTP